MGTLWVPGALRVVALDVGVAPPALGTEASGAVVPGLAGGRDAALGEAADVHTRPVQALVRQRALLVTVAAG